MLNNYKQIILKPIFGIVLLITAMAVMGVSLVSPALPEIRRAFDLSNLEAGYIITAYTFPAVILAPFAGFLADRYGRKVVLVPSLLLFGIGGGFAALSHNFLTLLSLRFIQGIGSTPLALLSRTLVGDHFEGVNRNTAMGLNDALLSLGASLYPFVGGILTDLHWRLPFLLYGISLIVSLVVFLSTSLTYSPRDSASSIDILNLSNLPKWPTLLLMFSTLLSFVLLYGVVHTVTPLLLDQEYGLSASIIGTIIGIFAALIALTSALNGVFAEYFEPETIISAGFLCFGLGMLGMSYSNSWFTYSAFLMILGIGHGLCLPSLNTEIVSLVDLDQRGVIMGLRTIMSRSGQTVGPILFPFLERFWQQGTIFQCSGLAIVTGASLVLTCLIAGYPISKD